MDEEYRTASPLFSYYVFENQLVVGIAENMQQLRFCISNRHEFTSA